MSGQKTLTVLVMIIVAAFQVPFLLIGSFGGLALLAIIIGFKGAQDFWENARRDLNGDGEMARVLNNLPKEDLKGNKS